MRTPQYLSPSAIKTWKQNQEEFYLRYLSDNKPPGIPQNQAMSIGSSFDAHAKAFLHSMLFGSGHDPKYELQALFEAQVEPHNRDWALQHGAYVFEQYKSSGALSDLMLDLKGAQGDPRFEFEIKGAVHGQREATSATIDSVVLLGKPDVYFINAHGCHVIFDFKVNGYCSRNPWSPMKGYIRMRSAGKTNHGMHKMCQPMNINGVMVNVQLPLDDCNDEWAGQLAIYAWLCGEPVGSQFVTAIDQIVCDATRGHLPGIRVAEHRSLVSRGFQERLFAEAVTIWETIRSDHVFRHMSKADSQARCQILDGQKEALIGNGSANDNWFASVTRG